MNKDTLIISMTSFPGRIGFSYPVWESVLKQEGIEQCHCVMVLTDVDFPNKEKDMPKDLLNLVDDKKIEIIWHPTNIRSHKKLLPTLLKYPDNPILIIDDDITRPAGWLKRYIEMHKKYPGDVLAGSIAYWIDQNGMVRRFPDIKGMRCLTFSNIPNLIYNTAKPSSGAGTLFPPHTFTDPRFFKEDLFMKLSPTSDESWIHCFLTIEDRTIRMMNKIIDQSEYYLDGTQQISGSLYKANNYQDINNRLFEAFPEFKEKLIERSKKIIVSLTSFKDRLKYVPQTIQSILNGTMQPSKIVLTLDRKDLPYIPEDLQRLIDDKKIELLVSDHLIKPHTKYFLTMQKYRDYAIITIDDDIEYTEDLVESLYNTYMLHPNCVCARRCHQIKWSAGGETLSYKNWGWQVKNYTEPRYDLFATGVGGVLYPPDILNIDDNMLDDVRKCLNADDIYLKWLEMKKGVKTVWVSNNHLSGYGNVDGTQEIALWKTNCSGNQNDEYLKLFSIPHIDEPEIEQPQKNTPPKRIPYSIEGWEGSLQEERVKRERNIQTEIPKTKVVFTVCCDEKIKPVENKPGYDYICFSDHNFNAPGWTVVVLDKLARTKNLNDAILDIKYHPTQYLNKKYQQMMYMSKDVSLDYIYYFNKIFGYKLGVIGDGMIYDHDYQSYLDKIWHVVSFYPEKEDDIISKICDEKVKIFT